MSLGLREKEITEILKEKGIEGDELCDAISTAITKNNQVIEKNVTDIVLKKIEEDLRRAGIRGPARF